MKVITALTVSAALAIGAAACSNPTTTPAAATAAGSAQGTLITASEVHSIAHGLLNGFSHRDYGAFSRDWDTALKQAIDRSAFEQFQQSTAAENGEYRSITNIERQPGRTAGTTNFFIYADFSKNPMVLRLNFHNDARQISGVELTPAK